MAGVVSASRGLSLSSSPLVPSLGLPQQGSWISPPRSSSSSRRPLRMVGTRAAAELVELRALSPSDPDLTWQVTAGAIAGFAPFVIAGIEFSKRIIQQRKCQVCGGSGLVKRAGILVRCNGCGGFLPWQSWSRFFSSRR